LPSIIPSYVYSIFASIVVGAIIVCSCGLSVSNIKQQAEQQQLSAIANYVASESMQLLSSSPADNFTSIALLSIPSSVGGQEYWLRVANDSSRAWVEVGFGSVPELTGQRSYIPAGISTNGTQLSGSGPVSLRCYRDVAGVHLTFEGGR
jgi:hypothetical protein